MEPNHNPYLKMKEISKSFPGVKALDNVSLEVKKGEILALLGENGAGKSTLMNILGGILKQDSGTILLGDKEVRNASPLEAQRNGVGFVHQELSLLPFMSVAENIYINSFPLHKKLPFINKKQMMERTRQIMTDLGLDINPGTLVKDLTVGKQQLVEIASVISKDVDVVIFDEPTSSLGEHEKENLMRIIDDLKKMGKVIIYITHDIDEALSICDKISVLRNGKNAGELDAKTATKELIIDHMVGRDVGKAFPEKSDSRGEKVVLSVRNYTRKDAFQNVSFDLHEGEILGVYGLMGAGRSELARAIFGLDPVDSGSLYVNGREITDLSPRSAKEAGMGFLTENRREEGLFLRTSLKENISITSLEKITEGKLRRVNSKIEIDIAEETCSNLNIICSSIEQTAEKLSGGNQQKVVLGKWLHIDADILILDEPTKGVDVGAKQEIYRLIMELAKKGKSIIYISSEIEEVIGLSNRILVMCSGEKSGEFDENAKQEELLSCAMR